MKLGQNKVVMEQSGVPTNKTKKNFQGGGRQKAAGLADSERTK